VLHSSLLQIELVFLEKAVVRQKRAIMECLKRFVAETFTEDLYRASCPVGHGGFFCRKFVLGVRVSF
jgi:hypothetical protein